jgi:glucosylceramidase
MQGGPNWVENYVDSPIIVVPQKDIFFKQPLYYVMTHFSKFIPRHSIKIEAKSTENSILVTAFKCQDNQIVVLLYNK